MKSKLHCALQSCESSGYYSMNNPFCGMLNDLQKAIHEQFKHLPEFDIYDHEDELFIVLVGRDGTEGTIDINAINTFANDWVKKNTKHVIE